MSETLIPTMVLRFVERDVLSPELMSVGGAPVLRTLRILQQLHHTPGGEKVWIDVPSVKDKDTP